MKVAIPIVSANRNSKLSLRFARSNYFAVVDVDTGNYHIIENPYTDLQMQAGKNSLEMLIHKENVDTLIAFELGLKIQQYAARSNIRLILLNDAKKTLDTLLKLMRIAAI